MIPTYFDVSFKKALEVETLADQLVGLMETSYWPVAICTQVGYEAKHYCKIAVSALKGVGIIVATTICGKSLTSPGALHEHIVENIGEIPAFIYLIRTYREYMITGDYPLGLGATISYALEHMSKQFAKLLSENLHIAFGELISINFDEGSMTINGVSDKDGIAALIKVLLTCQKLSNFSEEAAFVPYTGEIVKDEEEK